GQGRSDPGRPESTGAYRFFTKSGTPSQELLHCPASQSTQRRAISGLHGRGERLPSANPPGGDERQRSTCRRRTSETRACKTENCRSKRSGKQDCEHGKDFGEGDRSNPLYP